MQRCIVAPMEMGDLLTTAVLLTLQALQRDGAQRGDVLVFLPGIQDVVNF